MPARTSIATDSSVGDRSFVELKRIRLDETELFWIECKQKNLTVET